MTAKKSSLHHVHRDIGGQKTEGTEWIQQLNISSYCSGKLNINLLAFYLVLIIFSQNFIANCMLFSFSTTVNSSYLRVQNCPKLLISQSKFSGPRKFTFRYQ